MVPPSRREYVVFPEQATKKRVNKRILFNTFTSYDLTKKPSQFSELLGYHPNIGRFPDADLSEIAN